MLVMQVGIKNGAAASGEINCSASLYV